MLSRTSRPTTDRAIGTSGIDYSPLTSRVRRADVTALRRRPDTVAPRRVRAALRSAAVLSTAAWGCLVAAISVILSIYYLLHTPIGSLAWFLLFLPILLSLLFTRFLARLVARDVRPAGWKRWVRLVRFADANGFDYLPEWRDPWLPGTVFGDGRARQAYDCLTRKGDPSFQIGTYQYSVASVRAGMVRRWGYLAMPITVPVPHMVLASRSRSGRRGRSALNADFIGSQTLSLEGDFDRFFTLYAPKDYERDALYIFTPDLMAMLIDEVAAFDVEFVDDWMFVYSSKRMNPFSTRDVDRMLRIADLVGAKVSRRTARYRDDHNAMPHPAETASGAAVVEGAVPASGAVAAGGRRLRRGVSVSAIAVSIYALLNLWRTTTGIWFW